MEVFYVSDLSQDEAALPEDESRHLVKVLRAKTGAKVELSDGKGQLAEAVLTVSREACSYRIITRSSTSYNSYYLQLAIAPTKQADRLEWLVEKATELGVREISIVITARSERNKVNLERLERICVAAMKQSKRAFLPVVSPQMTFDQLMNRDADRKYIGCFLPAAAPFRVSDFSANNHILVAIGPAGDFTNQEIDLALSCNFAPLSLGTARLRTETAGIAVCAELAYLHSLVSFHD